MDSLEQVTWTIKSKGFCFLLSYCVCNLEQFRVWHCFLAVDYLDQVTWSIEPIGFCFLSIMCAYSSIDTAAVYVY